MSNLSSQDRKTLDNYTGMTVGQIFRRARKDQGYDIMDIAAHLNIGSTHLEAIEAEDIKSLPPKVYAVGFVRAYADVLALDPEKMAYLFKVQFYGKKDTEQHKAMIQAEGKTISIQETLSQKDNIIPALISAAVMALLVIAAFIFLIVWLVTPSDKSGQIKVPDVPDELSETSSQNNDHTTVARDENVANELIEESITAAVSPAEGATAYGVDPLEAVLAFKITDESWFQVRSLQDGKVLLTRTLNAGDVFYADEAQDILVTAGNAGGVEVFLDGESLGVLGDDAQVIRNQPFSVEALRLQQAD